VTFVFLLGLQTFTPKNKAFWDVIPRSSVQYKLPTFFIIIIIIIIIIIKLQIGWHPVAVVQYTFTHKQYTEYRGRSTHNN
jgi:hypothetical protein